MPGFSPSTVSARNCRGTPASGYCFDRWADVHLGSWGRARILPVDYRKSGSSLALGLGIHCGCPSA